MEAANIFETFVNFYQTTRRNISEDSHVQLCDSLGAAAGCFLKLFMIVLFQTNP
jgi:hypothetical protein